MYDEFNVLSSSSLNCDERTVLLWKIQIQILDILSLGLSFDLKFEIPPV